MSDLLVEIQGHVALVTLNRPEQMNALSAPLRAALVETFDRLDRDDDVRVAVLTGAGQRAFCAGLDLKELGAGGTHPAAIIEGKDDPVSTLNRFRKPIVGAINGVAITGGFELALACDVLIGSINARFADTHGLVGILPGWGLSQKLSRLVGPSRAKAMSFTGNFIDAQTALIWGLVNRITTPEDLMTGAMRLAADMANMPLDMLTAYKSLIDDGYGMTFDGGMALEQERSTAFNRNVTAEQIESRRAAVQERGRARAQSGARAATV
jgi:enoyl-CoA hydratase